MKSAKTLSSLRLSFDRSSRSGQVLSAISRRVSAFPNLENLPLSQMALSNEVLTGFISICKDTLQGPNLYDMILDSGSWGDLFTFLSNKKYLLQLYLNALNEGTRGVSFRLIHLERPIIDEYWFLHTYPPPRR